MKRFAFLLAWAVAVCASRADLQTFTTLLTFTGTSGVAIGASACGSLTLNGTALYGMTAYGGANGNGNIFSVGEDGTNYQNLLSFTGTSGVASGRTPNGGVTIVGATIYGVTQVGGANGYGNIFSVGVGGTNYQNLVSFTGSSAMASGNQPEGTLALAGTTLYGMTRYSSYIGYGGIFSIGVGGANFQDLLYFTGTGGTASGWMPLGSLTVGGTKLYGMTYEGGTNGVGNVFSTGTNATNYQNLVSFNDSGGTPSGRAPSGSLTVNGATLYGATAFGGSGYGNIFSVGTNGTNYQNLLSFTGTGGCGKRSGCKW
jgi:hypothetical protein